MTIKSGTPFAISKIITPGRYTSYALDLNGSGKVDTAVREYRISGLGRYLIAPQSIVVKRRLVGCDIHWKKSAGARLIPGFIRSWSQKRSRSGGPTTLVAEEYHKGSRLSNEGLQQHILDIEEKLRPFDSLQQALSSLDISKAEKIVGICQDRVGGRSPLAIKGDPAKQLTYMIKNAGAEVPVKLERAQIADGLFELQGFDAGQSTDETMYPLVRLTDTGKAGACVLNEDHSVAFWLNDIKTIGYLQLFEYCLQSNRKMREALGRCMTGEALPIRLLFNQALEIDYGKAPLPAFYQKIIEDKDQTSHLTRSIRQSLNHYQLGVSLNSLLQQGPEEEVLCTDISILQEMRALEPIRDRFPEVFKAVTQRASFSDAGRFYLLDSISGVNQHAA